MPQSTLTTPQRIHRLAHTLDATLTVVFDEWPDLRSQRQIRSLVRHTAWTLESLANSDDRVADENRQIVADLTAGLPNGDTTPGAT